MFPFLLPFLAPAIAAAAPAAAAAAVPAAVGLGALTTGALGAGAAGLGAAALPSLGLGAATTAATAAPALGATAAGMGAGMATPWAAGGLGTLAGGAAATGAPASLAGMAGGSMLGPSVAGTGTGLGAAWSPAAAAETGGGILGGLGSMKSMLPMAAMMGMQQMGGMFGGGGEKEDHGPNVKAKSYHPGKYQAPPDGYRPGKDGEWDFFNDRYSFAQGGLASVPWNNRQVPGVQNMGMPQPGQPQQQAPVAQSTAGAAPSPAPATPPPSGSTPPLPYLTTDMGGNESGIQTLGGMNDGLASAAVMPQGWQEGISQVPSSVPGGGMQFKGNIPQQYQQLGAPEVRSDVMPQTGGIQTLNPPAPNHMPPMGNRQQTGIAARGIGMPGVSQGNIPSQAPQQRMGPMSPFPRPQGGLPSINPTTMPAFGRRQNYAEGGEVKSAPSSKKDMELVSKTVQAIQGQIPNPKPVILKFIKEFGEDAFKDLVARVKGGSGQQSAPMGGGGPTMGPGDGLSDSIPATIGGDQPANLSNGEFVVPSDVVSHLGNGSTQAGADQLHQMMGRIRDMRGGPQAPPAVDPRMAMPA